MCNVFAVYSLSRIVRFFRIFPYYFVDGTDKVRSSARRIRIRFCVFTAYSVAFTVPWRTGLAKEEKSHGCRSNSRRPPMTAGTRTPLDCPSTIDESAAGRVESFRRLVTVAGFIVFTTVNTSTRTFFFSFLSVDRVS